MNINILMIASAVVILSSCSSAYKTAQTPDDIYYSAPAEQITGSRNGDEYVAVQKSGDRYSPNRDRYEDEDVYRNDRWLRMSIGSPYRLSSFNDYYWNDWRYGGMGYSSYGGFGLDFGYGSYGYMNSWNNPWGSSIYWNSFYNPYAYNYNPYGHWGGVGVISNPKPPVYNSNPGRSSVFNPRAYTNTSSRAAASNTNSGARTYYNPRTGTYSNYNNTNSASGSGTRAANTSGRARATTNTYYDTRQNGSSNRNESNTPSSNQGSSGRPERTYTPPSSSSSSGSGGARGSSGGGGEVRRPGRN